MIVVQSGGARNEDRGKGSRCWNKLQTERFLIQFSTSDILNFFLITYEGMDESLSREENEHKTLPSSEEVLLYSF